MGVLERIPFIKTYKQVKKAMEVVDPLLEPSFRRQGAPPKAKMAQIGRFIEKYGAEGVLDAIEIGIKGQNSGISFKLEITREDIKNDPQFVVNAIQIAKALKEIENPELSVAVQPSGVAKKIKEIQEAMGLAQGFTK